MANLNLKIKSCQGFSVGLALGWQNFGINMISSGRYQSEADKNGASAITKISFTTPPYLTSTEKIKLKVTGQASDTGSVLMYLSANNYTSASSIVNEPHGNYNGVGQELNSTKIGSSVSPTYDGEKVSFSATNISLQPNTTYYLYFLRYVAYDPDWKYAAQFTAHEIKISIDIADLITLPNPEILTTTQVLPYNGYLELEWNKVASQLNNAVKKYQIYLQIDKAPTLENYKQIFETTNTSQSISLQGIARGSSVFVGVLAVSIHDQYKETYPGFLANCNSNLVVFEVGKINSLPTEPQITSDNNVVGGDTQKVFTLNSTDADNQPIVYYYVLNNSERTQISGASLQISLQDLRSIGITETGTYTIDFYAYDTMEYSPVSSTTFRAEFAPIIATRTSTTIYVMDGLGSNQTYAKTIALRFTLKNDVTSGLRAVVRIGSENGKILNSESYTLNQISAEKIITIDVTKISTSILQYGEKFQLVFEILNSSNLSSGYDDWISSSYTRPSKLEFIPTVNITNDANISNVNWERNFKKSLTFALEAPTAVAGRPDISEINVIAINKENYERTYFIGKDEGVSYSLTVDLSDLILTGDSVTFKVQIKDLANQITEQTIENKYTRIEATSFGSGTSNILPIEINPHVYTGNLSLMHIIASNKTNSNIAVNYSYECQLSGQSFNFEVNDNNSTDTTISVYAKDIEDFNSQILSIVGSTANFNGTSQIIVTATDAFGQTAILTLNLLINTVTAPTFIQQTFNLYHDYDISSSISKEVQVTNDLNTQIFNQGEEIIFKIPAPKDPNNDVTGFKIYLYRDKLPANKNSIPSYNSISFGNTPWLTISTEDCALENEIYSYRYAASAYQENEFFYFKIVAIDSRGLESKSYDSNNSQAYSGYEAIYSNTYIIGARVVSSAIQIKPITTEINGTKVKTNFDLIINDLGGSATADNGAIAWDENYYNSYPNFDRVVSGITWQKNLLIEISPTSDFSQNVYSKEISYAERVIEFEGYPENSIRVYVRISLKIAYTLENGQQKFISSAPVVYSHFDDAPTVSHRAHRVGINTKAIDEGGVLVIQSYGEYNKIIIRYDESHQIAIDIPTQTITGLTIDGGNW